MPTRWLAVSRTDVTVDDKPVLSAVEHGSSDTLVTLSVGDNACSMVILNPILEDWARSVLRQIGGRDE